MLDFFTGLKESDWHLQVTDEWAVKDVLSHLIGWEREVVTGLKTVFKTGETPWFMLTRDYKDFNEKIYRTFKDSEPEILLSEFKRWREALVRTVEEIGEEKIRSRPHMKWVFDEGGEPHFAHHIKQIKKALQKYDETSIMIFSTMTPEKKKRISRWVVGSGVLALIVGFFPGWIAYQWGIVVFVFCLVATGIVRIIIPEPEPEEHLPNGESHVGKVLKTEDEEQKEKTDKAV